MQTECQCAAIGSRRPPDQSRPQQLQASSQSGEFDCPHRAEEPTTQHRLLGVGWPAEDMLHSQEQNSAGWLQNEDYPGDAAAKQGEVQGDRGEWKVAHWEARQYRSRWARGRWLDVGDGGKHEREEERQRQKQESIAAGKAIRKLVVFVIERVEDVRLAPIALKSQKREEVETGQAQVGNNECADCDRVRDEKNLEAVHWRLPDSAGRVQ